MDQDKEKFIEGVIALKEHSNEAKASLIINYLEPYLIKPVPIKESDNFNKRKTPKPYSHWTKDNIIQLINLYQNQTKDIVRLATLIGRNRMSVRNKIWRLSHPVKLTKSESLALLQLKKDIL